jgi:hypothetical protein
MCTRVPTLWVAWYSTSLKMLQKGSAKPTWATMPSPKKVLGRALVRSKIWSGMTTSSGAIDSFMLPQALTEMIRPTPSDLRA